jgi:hypothetical protein
VGKKESTAWRILTIPKEEALLLAKFSVVPLERFFPLFNKILELAFFGERDCVDSLKTIFSCVALPVASRVLQKFKGLDVPCVLDVWTCTKIDEVSDFVYACCLAGRNF